jgi:hypothetical protein
MRNALAQTACLLYGIAVLLKRFICSLLLMHPTSPVPSLFPRTFFEEMRIQIHLKTQNVNRLCWSVVTVTS